MITPASFRIDFPEFRSTVTYPSSTVSYYLALAGLLLNKTRWGSPSATAKNPPDNMYDMATELFVAHHIVIEAMNSKATIAGGIPGVVQGPVNSKSVGPVSISYAPGDVVIADAGHWNLTTYGVRFRNLSRMFGAGPIQLGVGPLFCGPFYNNVPLNGPAYPGPMLGYGSIN